MAPCRSFSTGGGLDRPRDVRREAGRLEPGGQAAERFRHNLVDRLSGLPPRRPDFRHLALDRGRDFDLASAHQTAPATRVNHLRGQHEGVGTELLADARQRITHGFSPESLQMHVTPAPSRV